MKQMVVLACAVGALAGFDGPRAQAQTMLSPGDLVFTGYDSSGTDQVSFVLARDVAAGTTVTFTDRGWLAAGGFRSGEGAFELTLDADLPCGTELVAVMSPLEVRDAAGAVVGTTAGGGLQLSTSGDQVFAYQGAEPTAGSESGLLAAIQMNGGWDADATSTNTSALPASLVDGVHAVAIAPEQNNARYDCSVVSAEPGVLAAVIHDASAWLVDDATPFDLSSACGFTCAGGCVDPELPALGGDTEITAGEDTLLTVEGGALGNAGDWHWYVDGCGATHVGTGASLSLSPSDTVDVFVRGEGGCVVPGPCSRITITVDPPAPMPQTAGQQKCVNLMLGRLAVVSRIQGREAGTCAKLFARGKTDSAETCIATDPAGKVAKARAKVASLHERKCAERPDFGFAGPALLADAGESESVGLFTDVVGVAFDGTLVPRGDDPKASKCQLAIVGSAAKCMDARLKEYAKCVKAGLKDGSITTAGGLVACIGADPKGKIAAACDLGTAGEKKVDTVRKALAKLCLGAEVAPSLVLAGCPGAVDVESAHACLTSRLGCRACRAVDRAGALGAPCDALDDGVANGSCPA